MCRAPGALRSGALVLCTMEGTRLETLELGFPTAINTSVNCQQHGGAMPGMGVGTEGVWGGIGRGAGGSGEATGEGWE